MAEADELLAATLPHCWHTTDPDTLIETGFHAFHLTPPGGTADPRRPHA